jgi:hypothetical protein
MRHLPCKHLLRRCVSDHSAQVTFFGRSQRCHFPVGWQAIRLRRLRARQTAARSPLGIIAISIATVRSALTRLAALCSRPLTCHFLPLFPRAVMQASKATRALGAAARHARSTITNTQTKRCEPRAGVCCAAGHCWPESRLTLDVLLSNLRRSARRVLQILELWHLAPLSANATRASP